jgi:hypothetical protein
LEVERVCVRRLQNITEDDARAEGVEPILVFYDRPGGPPGNFESHVAGFRTLWNSLNAKRGYGWDANPWVFATTFRRVE